MNEEEQFGLDFVRMELYNAHVLLFPHVLIGRSEPHLESTARVMK